MGVDFNSLILVMFFSRVFFICYFELRTKYYAGICKTLFGKEVQILDPNLLKLSIMQVFVKEKVLCK